MRIFLLFLSFICILQSNGQIINTVAGGGSCGSSSVNYCGDGGPAISAKIYYSSGIAFDASGNLYIADTDNHCIRKVDSNGMISTFAGTGVAGFSGDGGPAISAKFIQPWAIAFDTAGNLFISDQGNNRIRKVKTNGIISTIAGNGIAGYSGDGGAATAAELQLPFGICTDITGNVYIADRNNERIRKVGTNGIIKTIAGNGSPGYSGDGSAAINAKLYAPTGITIDSSGNLYIADWENNRVRKVKPNGIITTIAGNGNANYTGDGGLATAASLYYPAGITIDKTGNIYIADQLNNVIRLINSAGIISTFAGTGNQGYGGDGGPATAAYLNYPTGVALDVAGNLFIADQKNHLIRKVSKLVDVTKFPIGSNNISIYPNPTYNQFIFQTDARDKQRLDLFDVSGNHIFNKTVCGETIIDISDLPEGIYTLTIKTRDQVINKKLVVTR